MARIIAILLGLLALGSLARGELQLSGCANFSSDDLTNRVTKKSTLSFVTRLLEASKVVVANNIQSCPELTFQGFNINLQPLEDFARLATRNGHVMHDMLNSKSRSFLDNVNGWPVPTNPSGSIVAPAKGCSNEANPFAHGNSIFGSLTQSTLLSSRRIFAAGGCLGINPTTSTSECFYRFVQYSTNTTPVDYGLYPISSNTWFTIPQNVVQEINRTLVTTGSLDGVGVPASMERMDLNGRIINRLNIGYSTRLWTDPYFDCLLGKIWMITYSAPISYVADDGQVHNVGITGVDINLSDIDLDECSPSSTDANTALDSFRNTHLCEATSTMCRTVAGRGFNFGSYQCHCRPGFYRRSEEDNPLPKARQFFEGTAIDNATLSIRSNSRCGCNDTAACSADAREIRAVLESRFSCLRCPPGCDTCVNGNEICIVTDNRGVVIGLTTLNIIFLLMLAALVIFVFQNRTTRVIRSASWPFLITILLGAALAVVSTSIPAFAGSFTSLVISNWSCALTPWLWYIGFALTYGSILVKTWRLHQIFSTKRFRGKGRRSLSNSDLGVMLLVIVASFAVLLLFWTIGRRPVVQTLTTSASLKYNRCSVSFVDHIMSGVSLAFLLPVVYLSFQLRNITDDFSETKEISLSAYIFLVVKIISLVASLVFNLNPDIQYVLRFLEVNLSFTLLVAIFFSAKILKVVGFGEESKDSAGFILNKKRKDAHQSVVSLDEAHRRQSTASLEGPPTSIVSTATTDTSSGIKRPQTSGDIENLENVAYLPSVFEDKGLPPPVTVSTTCLRHHSEETTDSLSISVDPKALGLQRGESFRITTTSDISLSSAPDDLTKSEEPL